MENKNENLTDIEKAKELFAYEMTEILLNFREEMAKPKANPDAAYLDAEVPAAQLEYAAPEIALKGIGYHMPEQTAPFEAAVLRAEAVKPVRLTAGSAVVPELLPVPEISAQDPAAIRAAVTQTELTVPGADSAGKLIAAAAFRQGAPQIAVSLPAEIPEAPQIAALPAEAAVPQIAVTVPDTAVNCAVFAAKQAEIPAAKLPDSADYPVPVIDGSRFSLPQAEDVSVSVAYELPQTAGFRMPEIPQHTVTAPQYPEVPEKPDISGAVTDILAAVRAEISRMNG